MTNSAAFTIRAFDGSLADAQGLLDVERATFDESPYDAGQVQVLLNADRQQAWLALRDGRIVGFVVAFATEGLKGRYWEIDLLAVHPQWRGHGLATQLIRTASKAGIGRAEQARAVVAQDNRASAAAFTAAAFRPSPEVCHLLIHRELNTGRHRGASAGIAVHEADGLQEARPWLRLTDGQQQAGTDAGAGSFPPGLCLLVADQGGEPAGYAELIDVQTLLYRGTWIESLVGRSRAVRDALIRQILSRAAAAGLDEVGAMVQEDKWIQEQALRIEGFRSLGAFRWYRAPLGLSGLEAMARDSASDR